MPISSLRFTNVGPFEEAEFHFDKQVNVFTGPNNSGKSTSLMVLGEVFVYPFGVPKKLIRADRAIWQTTILNDSEELSFSGHIPVNSDQLETTIKPLLLNIGYSTFVPAVRQSTDFRSRGPTGLQRKESWLEGEIKAYLQREPNAFAGRSMEDVKRAYFQDVGPDLEKRTSLVNPELYITTDEDVIQRIIELDYRAYREEKPQLRNLISKLVSMASEITEGFPINFTRIGEDSNGLFPQFKTLDGEVELNALSQGTQSIIQWLAQLILGCAEYYDYPPDLEEKRGILIIDEIDAHLHPSWQRRIIPTLTSHFPNFQIFCSTHSPLMLAGLKEGQVQLLKRDEKGKVTVSRNETDIIGWSADEILRNYLDVQSPTDLATVGHIERLQVLRRKENLTTEEAEELERLRNQVNQDLLAGPIAAQTERFSNALKQADEQSSPETKPTAGTKPKASRKRRSANR